MTNWKKTISAVTSAALLASVLATSAFAQVGTAGQSDQTNVLDCSFAAVHTLANCSQVADGISTVTLSGDVTPARTETGKSLYITAAGATIIGVGGQFLLAGGIVTGPAGQVIAATDTISLRAPAAAGSATVSVYEITTATGIAALEGTLTITFTATSGLTVSAAQSTVKIVAYDATPTAAECTAATAVTNGPANVVNNATLCVTVNDGNGNPVNAPMVAVTITPVGLINGAQSASGAADAVGFKAFQIQGSTLAGVATIGISVTQGTTTTAFTPKTYTFSGVLATITATSQVLAVYWDANSDHAVRFTGKDAAGNKVFFEADNTFSSDTTVFTIDHVDEYDGAGGSFDGAVEITCLKVGSANVVVKEGTLASNAVKVYCSDVPDSFTVAFDKTTVAPGGSAKLTVTALDENGQPAAGEACDEGCDTFGASVIVSSGAITPVSALIGNGATVHTYLAPFNVGVATALVVVDGITDSKSASINIGAVVAVGGTAASALGVTKTGPFTTATKLPALGKYVTVKMSLGASAAGKTVEIWRASKSSAGVWSAFTKLTARVADASGNVYFYWRSSSAAWLSFYGVLDGARTNSSQARWR